MSEVIFTESAASRVAEILVEEDNNELKLRIQVQGGGCSGFQYGFDLTEDANEGDLIVVTDGITLLIDPISLQYLEGATVDFVKSLQGDQFVINNPNATTTCGCGSSFS